MPPMPNDVLVEPFMSDGPVVAFDISILLKLVLRFKLIFMDRLPS